MELDCLPLFWASQVAQWSKNPPGTQEIQETSVRSLGRKIPWRREWQPTPGILAPGNPMDMTEATEQAHTHLCSTTY